jgi:NADH dehydrogenase
MRRIVVLGTGFGGLHAIQHLERALSTRRRVSLTVVTDNAHFLFTPLLPNVANGQLSLKAITLPLRDQLSSDTHLVIDRVRHVDLEARVLHTDGQKIPFDYLLLAPGAQTDWHGKDSFKPFALTCKSSRDATQIRETIERAYAAAAKMPAERRARHLTFAFAGAGPTGVELAAEIHASLRRNVFPKASPELVRGSRFLLVDPAPQILTHLPASLQGIARSHLEQHGVELMLERSVTQREAEVFTLDDGTEVACDHFFWCAGVKPNELIATNDMLALDERGRAYVDGNLQALGHEGIFVIGDAASTPALDPQTAQVAKQQGPVAAANILASMSGRTLRPWRLQHLGDMLTLGQGKAAVSVMGSTIEGLPAYAMYRLAYAGLMPGSMKKLRIMAEWLEHDLSTSLPSTPSQDLLEP